MNASDFKRINKIISLLEEMQADLDTLVRTEEDKIGRRSEKYLESDKGTLEQENLSELQEGLSGVETALSALCNISSEKH